jgi:hypothetical protein
MLVKIIEQVPDILFNSALEEIQNIDWSKIDDSVRRRRAEFATSSSIHIRVASSKLTLGKKSVNEMSTVCECEDNAVWSNQFNAVRRLSDWMFKTVNGKTLGRIMIVNLEPRGQVPLHVDPKDYFEMYSRFHVPFKTNPNVVFNGGEDTENEHMPLQYLSRLNNRLPHQLDNNSDENRIHLIVDIETEGGNQIF